MSLRPPGGGGLGPRYQEIPEHNFSLKIISYGHAHGPLVVPENANRVKLLYSVRDVPNPPNLLRKKYTGVSARMRKEVLGSKEGRARMDQIQDAIEFKMLEMSEDYSRAPTPEITAQDLYPAKESPRELIVGIMCEEGRHRSVAFAEDLGKNVARRQKWVIEVQHRDLGDIASSEDEDDDNNEEQEQEDGSISPTLSRKISKTAKQKDKERRKMIGRKISSVIDGE